MPQTWESSEFLTDWKGFVLSKDTTSPNSSY